MTMDDLCAKYVAKHDVSEMIELASFIRNKGARTIDQDFADDAALTCAIHVFDIVNDALEEVLDDPDVGGTIYIRYARGKVSTRFDELDIHFTNLDYNSFVVYDKKGELPSLAFCVSETNLDKRHYMDGDEQTIKEAVVSIVEQWKEVMLKLFLLFGTDIEFEISEDYKD